jgi:hypothetical protein
MYPRNMVIFRYISVNTLHKGDDSDDDNNNTKKKKKKKKKKSYNSN